MVHVDLSRDHLGYGWWIDSSQAEQTASPVDVSGLAVSAALAARAGRLGWRDPWAAGPT